MAVAGYRPSERAWAETGDYGMLAEVMFGIGAILTAGGWLMARTTGWQSPGAAVRSAA